MSDLELDGQEWRTDDASLQLDDAEYADGHSQCDWIRWPSKARLESDRAAQTPRMDPVVTVY